MQKENIPYLTIHGHFYQPPRENPWLEEIEFQQSASPFHDWNARINNECYNPNSFAKIVDSNNKILDIINNYGKISFNFGPTLMSWLEVHAPYTYERIIGADVDSVQEFSGHGNAMAQVYNHMIMPLANKNDKITQVIWGIEDFKYRYGRIPEGMWLAETAVNDETLEVLADNGIKFTVLSPFQAKSYRKLGEKSFIDVSWGTIDPARPYRYFIKNNPEKYVDLFFYDGAISKSVAFDELLKDGNKFFNRLKDGVSSLRDYTQIVNIATDGESYGHHTKFGDMALAYVLRIKAKDDEFKITNYGEFLEKFPPQYEVDIIQDSSWSCSHGVGRWKEDCGCSTGAQAGWNQKWRKPLREALDYLRDELAVIFEQEGAKYFNNPWDARNKYIQIILDRNEKSIKKYLKEVLKPDKHDFRVEAMKLLEIQRQAMLMYTSCGWFFAEISGIETTQIMKYAARAMQLAGDFSDKDLETNFLNILAQAKSNIPEFGTGKDVYEKFVKPSIITMKQIATLWAVDTLYSEIEEETSLYCYKIKHHNYRKIDKGTTHLIVARLEVQSTITLEKTDFTLVLLQFSSGDFHCSIKEFSDSSKYQALQRDLIKTYLQFPLTEIIRMIDECFGKEYYTLKDIFIEKRRKILRDSLQDKLNKFSLLYRQVYEEGRSSIYNLQSLGLKVPNEFKIAAQYILNQEFNNVIKPFEEYIDEDAIPVAVDILNEANMLEVELDKSLANEIFAKKITEKIYRFASKLESHRLEWIMQLFDYIDKLQLNVDISEAQSIYYSKIYHYLGEFIEEIENKSELIHDKKFLFRILELGEKLNINTDFYKSLLLTALHDNVVG
ncbi:DUF3536 domain-containing protein [bacterium]|nr:DUF3536 domain-containing protein [bacterium]